MKNIPEYPVKISYALLEDIPAIQRIARQYAKELGFLREVSIREYIQQHTVYTAKIEQQVVGFVLFRARQDGWNVIYDIAVDKDCHRQGIGRMLLFAVPTPTRLKCTQDNPANDFYTSCGFNLIGTESGRKHPLSVYQKKFLNIICKGSSPYIPDIAYKVGSAYGTRHTEKPLVQPFMVDIHWKKYDWTDYLHKVSLWKPVFAVVADYENPTQRRTMQKQIIDLRQLGVLRIGVCPKFDGAVYDIPESCIVCVSVPSKYAGFLPPKEEIKGRKLHLLGGAPRKQIEYIINTPLSMVVSLDGSAITRAAQFGSLYDDKTNRWKLEKYILPDAGFSYYNRIEYSAKNLMSKLASLDF